MITAGGTPTLPNVPYRDFEVDVVEDPCEPSGYEATPVPTRRYIRGYGLCATEDDQGNMEFVLSPGGLNPAREGRVRTSQCCS